MYIAETEKGSGSSSNFMSLRNKNRCGFKEFYDISNAQYSYRLQKDLSDRNLAPKVLSQIGRIRFSDGSSSEWGYVSETARLMPKCLVCYDDVCYADDYVPGCSNARQINSVVRKLRKLDISYFDSHSHNFGYIRRNRKYILVPIDFGSESVG